MTINEDIRVVGLDLDSTLLKDDKTISDRTKQVIQKAIDRGIYILPATGRTLTAIPACVKEIEGIQYAVCSNGATVLDLTTGKELYSCKIPKEDAKKLVEILEGFHTMYDCYIEGRGYTEYRFYNHLDDYRVEPQIQKLIKQSRKPVENLLDEIERIDCDVEKFNMFFYDMKKREEIFAELSRLPFIKVTSSLFNNLEINAAECNKGTALLEFARLKGFDKGQVMCCGDGNNDLDMIRLCGVGVAMMNGEDRIKEAADYITYSNEEDGVARAIERLCIRMQEDDTKRM